MRRSVVAGCGGYLPARILTNEELSKTLDTTDEWISERTGIRQRHVAAPDEMTSDIGLAAAQAALTDGDIDPDSIDMVVLATSTPDQTFPATATVIQAGLGMTRGAAFDLQAVCSGFVFAMATADNFVKSGQADTVVVVGAETYSRILDWEDRGTCVLFGDGGGAVVLRAVEATGANASDPGVLSTHLFTDGRFHDLLYVDGGPSSTKTTGHVRMQGREVYRHAVVKMADAITEALDSNGLSIDDIDWFVPHQANRRIIESTATKLGLPREKVVLTVDRHANTSSASIPLALAEAQGDGRLKRGDLVLMEALGGGLTWGSCLVRW